MNLTQLAAGLYPIGLTGANVGLGVVLYRTGATLPTLLLWLAGAAVLAGVVAKMGPQLTRLQADEQPERR